MTAQTYALQVKPYRRQFCQPLKTHHGLWSFREGILVGLQQDKVVGWGEIAPLPWFGTETLEDALNFCHQLPNVLTQQEIFTIPDRFPACQFGFGSAWERLVAPVAPVRHTPQTLSKLLPAGPQAATDWADYWAQGYRTFKLKIGVYDLEEELQIFQTLAAALPASARLRLDANGGLTFFQAQRWLEVCDATTQISIEYLEQPLPVDEFDRMVQFTQAHRTPLALDESIATLQQLQDCHRQGWQGVMVIKPAIAGYPQALREFLQDHPIDAVFSSVFETEVGRNAALKLAQDCGIHRAVGFGVEHWFAEVDHDSFALA